MLEPDNFNPQKYLLEANKLMPHLVLLEGEAGMGKSYALERVSTDLKHALLVGASGWLNQVLSKARALLTDERDPAFLAAARLIASEANWAQVAQAPVFSDRESLWRAIAQALERLARRLNGLTLLLEDGHAMSEDDVLALRVVYRRAKLGHAPLLIVLSSRPTEKDLLEGFVQDAIIANASEPERLTLSRLTEYGVQNLVQEHLHHQFLPDNLVAWLHARTEGHALYTLELLRFLRDGGALKDLGVTWVFEAPQGKAVPKTLEASLQARVANARRDSKT